METPAPLHPEALKAFEMVPDLYLVLSTELKILTASDAYLATTQTARKGLVGRPVFDALTGILSPMAVKDLRDSLQQVLSTKKPHRIPLQHLSVPHPAGKHWFALSSPVLNEQGGIQYIIQKLDDAAAPIKADDSLVGEHRHLEDAQAVGAIGSFERVFTENKITWSDELYRIHGLEPQSEEISVERLLSFIHPKDRQATIDAIRYCQATGEPLELTQRIITAKGELKYVHRRVKVLKDLSGKPVKICGTVQDLTAQHFSCRVHHRKGEYPSLRPHSLGIYTATVNAIDFLGAVQDLSMASPTDKPLHTGNLPAVGQKQASGRNKSDGDNPVTGKAHGKAPADLPGDAGNETAAGEPGAVGKAATEQAAAVALQGSRASRDFHMEYRLVNDDGEVRHFVGTGHFRADEKDSPFDGLDLVIDITEQKKAEQELLRIKEELSRRASDKYCTLFNSIDEGFFICEVLYDEHDSPTDILYLEANPAATRIFGQNFVGRRLRDIDAGYEAHWYEIFGRVAKTGVAERWEQYAQPTKTWYSFYVLKTGDHYTRNVAVLFQDVTERKRREANLAFLKEISDEFSCLSTADEIMQMVGQKMGSYLNLSLISFLDVDESRKEELTASYCWAAKGFQDLAGQSFRIRDFLTEEFEKACRAREPFVIHDTQADARANAEAYSTKRTGAFVGVPFFRNGAWKYYLYAAAPQPRTWRQDEIELFQELTNRIFPRLERAQAEEALRQSEEKYRLLFTTMAEAFLLGEAIQHENGAIDFLYLDVNPAFEQNSGLTRETAVGRLASKVAPPLPQTWMETVKRVGLEGEFVRFEEHFAPQGKWYENRLFPVGEKGSGKFGAIISDITSRKRSEQQLREFNTLLEQQVKERTFALQESKERFEAAINVSPVALVILKSIRDETRQVIDFHLDWVSTSGKSMAGRDISGQVLTEAFPYLGQTGMLQKLIHTAEANEPTEHEFHYSAGKYEVWVRWKAVKLEDGLFASVEDITKRKKAEQELVKNYQVLKQAEEVASMGSWEYNVANKELIWSEGMYRLFGLPAGSPVSPNIYQLHAIDSDLPVAEKIGRHLERDQEPPEETIRVAVHGEEHTIRVQAVALRNREGKVEKILGIDLDISKVKKLEQENLQMQLNQQKMLLFAILEAQEEEKRRISEALHDGVSQVLYAAKLKLDHYRSQFKTCQGESVPTLCQVDQILKQAIIQTRCVSHELTPNVLEQFGLEAAFMEIESTLSSHTLQLQCLALNLPTDLEKHLQIAVYRMAQELANNIVKHAQATEASLILQKQKDLLILIAEDNGAGFDTTKVSGKGIGLNSIKDRVKLLNGSCQLSSAPGSGTMVKISLPLQA